VGHTSLDEKWRTTNVTSQENSRDRYHRLRLLERQPLFQSTAVQPATTQGTALNTQASNPSALAAINWSSVTSFDTGYESSVAIHPSGLIVEVYSSGGNSLSYTGLYYHIGKLDPVAQKITWGPSHRFVPKAVNGSWPCVAITKEGYVIILWSNGFVKSGSKLRYSNGSINLAGDTNQLITFKAERFTYDTGFHCSLSVNYNGIFAEATKRMGARGFFTA
jgi:hypothetical protein